MGRKRNLKYKEYFKMLQKTVKVAPPFDKGESLFLLFPERALSKYVVMDRIVYKKSGFMAGRYNDAKGSHTIISYPTSTDANTIRRMIPKIDRYFKAFSYCGVMDSTGIEIAGFKKIERDFGIDTNIKKLVKLRNRWIIKRANELKKKGKKGTLVYKIIQKDLGREKPYLNLWQPRKRFKGEVQLKNHYDDLKISTIKNIVTQKK